MSEFRLCYVDRPRVYFTSTPLDKQTGDDWNDAPYSSNAGPPYVHNGEHVFSVEIGGTYYVPEEMCGLDFSVDQINTGVVPWLTTVDPWGGSHNCVVHLRGGATWPDFLAACQQAGWTIARPIDAGPVTADAIPEWVNWEKR